MLIWCKIDQNLAIFSKNLKLDRKVQFFNETRKSASALFLVCWKFDECVWSLIMFPVKVQNPPENGPSGFTAGWPLAIQSNDKLSLVVCSHLKTTYVIVLVFENCPIDPADSSRETSNIRTQSKISVIVLYNFCKSQAFGQHIGIDKRK